MPYRPIESTPLYRTCCNISNEIWFTVNKWSTFAKQSLGLQLVKAADSVAANLVEGDARHFYRDSIKFFDYAKSSAQEAGHWVRVATERGLIGEQMGVSWIKEFEEIGKMINGLIGYRRRVMSDIVKEETADYDADP